MKVLRPKRARRDEEVLGVFSVVKEVHARVLGPDPDPAIWSSLRDALQRATESSKGRVLFRPISIQANVFFHLGQFCSRCDSGQAKN